MYAEENEEEDNGAVDDAPIPTTVAAVAEEIEPIPTFDDGVEGAGVTGEGEMTTEAGMRANVAGDGGVSRASSDTSVSDDMDRCDMSSDSEAEEEEEDGETAAAWSCG